jgi:hypothetical protein
MRWWEVKNNKTNQQANNAVLTLIGCLKHIWTPLGKTRVGRTTYTTNIYLFR